MKKIPLYFGLFLIMVWGANRKIVPSFEGDDKARKGQEFAITYIEKFDKSLDLSTLSWEEFYRVYHPQFSELTETALYQLYEELKSKSLYTPIQNAK